MIFEVTRTSSDKKPCAEAKHKTVTLVRGVKWRLWTVRINTLKELIQFYQKHGNLVIQGGLWAKSPVQLEIYDDYRE